MEFRKIVMITPEKAMAPHSSTLAWKIPWTEEPGRLRSMGSQRVERDWATSLSLFTFMHWRRKWQPTRVLAWRIPGTGEPRGLPSTGLHRVGHDWSDLASVCTCQPQSPRFFVNKVICGNVNWYSHCRNNMEPPSKTKNRTTIWPNKFTLWYLSDRKWKHQLEKIPVTQCS